MPQQALHHMVLLYQIWIMTHFSISGKLHLHKVKAPTAIADAVVQLEQELRAAVTTSCLKYGNKNLPMMLTMADHQCINH